MDFDLKLTSADGQSEINATLSVDNPVYDSSALSSGIIADVLGYVPADSSKVYTKEEIEAKGYLTSYTETDPIWSSEKSQYYTKTEVDAKIPEETDLSDYYTKEEIDGKGYLTQHQDISGKADKADTYTKSEVDALIPEEPDLSDYYTKSEVDSIIPEKVDLSDYYTKSEVDGKGYLTEYTETDPIWNSEKGQYYTKTEVDGKGYLTEHQDISGKADKADTYTKTEVDALIPGEPDLSDYYTKSEVDGKGYLTSYTETDPVWTAAKDNYYTKTEVDAKIPDDVDLTNYYTKTETDDGFATKSELSSVAEGHLENQVSGQAFETCYTLSFSRGDGDPAIINIPISTTTLSGLMHPADRNKIDAFDPSTFLKSESDPVWTAEKTNYYTKTEIDEKGYLTSYTETDPIWTAAKDNYYTKSEVDAKIPEDVDLTNYYTKTEIDEKGYLTSYTETDPVWTSEKSNYYTKEEVDDNLATKSEVSSVAEGHLENGFTTGASATYYNITFVRGDGDAAVVNIPLADDTNAGLMSASEKAKLAGIDLSNYIKEEGDPVWNREKSSYYTKTEVDALIPEETDLSDYYTKEEVDAKIPDDVDLTNYYTKTEIDSKGYIDSDNLSTFEGVSGEIVITEGTDTISIGLADEIKTKINSGGGTTDLSDYYTKEEVDEKGYLTSYTETDPIWSSEKSNYYTKEDVDGKGYLTSYTESDPVWTSEKGQYYTKTEVDGKGYLTEHQSLSDYYTKTEVDDLIPEETDLTNYYTKTEIDDKKYLTSYTETDPVWTADKTNYYTKTEVDAAISAAGGSGGSSGGSCVWTQNSTSKGISYGTNNCEATGSYSVAIGQDYTKATGEHSFAQGDYSKASGQYSVAIGYDSRATSQFSMALKGGYTDGYSSFAVDGYAGNNYSIAIGSNTKAYGPYSLVFGYNCTSYGEGSVAIGKDTYTDYGYGCCAIGKGSYAHDYGEVAVGCGNTSSYGQQYSYSSSNNAFVVGISDATQGSGTNGFRVNCSGSVYGMSDFNSSGADYAEYFEWEDGNPDNEDRIGHFVSLTTSGKIKVAEPEEDVIGVISGISSMIGNANEDMWEKRYLRDIYGRLLKEYKEVEDKDGNKHTVSYLVENPEYDSTQKYIPRSQRKEWAVVGLLGQVIIIDDGTCLVGKKCSVKTGGVATLGSDYRVIKRLDDTHIVVLANFI